eukprot:GHVS01106810.1.p1 GENE.GHVS01106810.1~~GHVS01106810.1.p1  ORF type:complete len:279 (+),score=70.16 GHVS01106810.1:508-1344(+)
MLTVRRRKIKKCSLRNHDDSQSCIRSSGASSECTTVCPSDYYRRSVSPSPYVEHVQGEGSERVVVVGCSDGGGGGGGITVRRDDAATVVDIDDVATDMRVDNDTTTVKMLDDGAVVGNSTGDLCMDSNRGARDATRAAGVAAKKKTSDAKKEEEEVPPAMDWTNKTEGGKTGWVQWTRGDYGGGGGGAVLRVDDDMRVDDIRRVVRQPAQSNVLRAADGTEGVDVLWDMSEPCWRWCFGRKRTRGRACGQTPRSNPKRLCSTRDRIPSNDWNCQKAKR